MSQLAVGFLLPELSGCGLTYGMVEWWIGGMFDVVGNNKKLKLTGRPSDVAGVLATGKLYTLGEQVLAFFPQVC